MPLGQTLQQMDKDEQEIKQLEMQNKRSAALLKKLDILDQLVERTQAKQAAESAGSMGGSSTSEGITGEPTPVRGADPSGAMGADFINELIPIMLGLQGYGADMGPAVNLINSERDPKRELIRGVMGGNSPVNLQPGNASSTQKGNGLAAIIDAAAKGDPEAAAQLGILKMAGIDVGDMVGNVQAAMRGYSQDSYDPSTGYTYTTRYNLDGTPKTGSMKGWQGSFKTVPLPGGGAIEVPVVGPNVLPGGIPSKLPESDQPIPMGDLASWRHPDTLGSPPAGITPKQAQEQGYKRVSTNAATTADALKGVNTALTEIKGLMVDVFPKEESTLGRVPGALKRKTGSLAQSDPKAAQLEALLGGTLSLYIRALGEKGTLAEGDVKRAMNLVPKLTDRADVAWGKIRQLEGLFRKVQAGVISGGKAKAKKDYSKMTDAELLEEMNK